MHSDLSQYESAVKLGIVNFEDESESDSVVQLGLSKSKSRSTSRLPSNDLNYKLRGELTRSLVGQRLKREEIKRLRATLEAKEKEIQFMKEQEKKYFQEVEKFKVEHNVLI